MVDKFLLEYEIKRHGYTISSYREHIGMSRSAYWRKTNCKSEFTQGEIQKSIDLLPKMSPMAVFFSQGVS